MIYRSHLANSKTARLQKLAHSHEKIYILQQTKFCYQIGLPFLTKFQKLRLRDAETITTAISAAGTARAKSLILKSVVHTIISSS